MAIQLPGFKGLPLAVTLSKCRNLIFHEQSHPWQACRIFFLFPPMLQLKCITWPLLCVFSIHLDPGEMLWISIPVDSLREPASVPSRSPAFWRLIGISRLPDSSSIKSHLANLTIWDWMKNKWDRLKEGEREREREIGGVQGGWGGRERGRQNNYTDRQRGR